MGSESQTASRSNLPDHRSFNDVRQDYRCSSRPFLEWYNSEYSERTRQQDADEGWRKCARRLREHDEDIVKAWKEEIDTLLVFAGLFSTALTAFNVEFYSALNPADATPVWINALWFSSLISSLSAASIGIIVRQWLGHFISPTSPDPRRSVEIHCLRYDMGLIRWRVPEILGLLPILLLMSLVLFFVGLAVLLWALNRTVAIIALTLISTLFAFLFFTTLIPAISFDCPYKSPQALLTYWLLRSVYHTSFFRLPEQSPRIPAIVSWSHRIARLYTSPFATGPTLPRI
ncbi:hypothetical protein OBBRIDRAFT_246622 [Obba rivulosa]|uniref:DUF6535 domain-containing protein n=1 Tax=Obba rivulosa TaxID=1052685 RepID=A0A8E2AT95_9APHY|nr:hypothetical protein OBBRIDRAFT_246622 [Obba rivulosa]